MRYTPWQLNQLKVYASNATAIHQRCISPVGALMLITSWYQCQVTTQKGK